MPSSLPTPNLETRFRLLRALESQPELSQRQLAALLGVSLGKTHYCLKALIEKGWVKAGNFSRSPHKHRYLYQLTPSGVAARARLTKKFLQAKRAEHARLTEEIERLMREQG